jgi:hypothetical protein
MSTILSFGTYNDASGNEFAIVFLSDGSAQQVGVLPAAPPIDVAPAGTFATAHPYPELVSVGLAGETVVCIISTTGYFIWNGTSFFQQGTASPVVDIQDGGTNYTSPPTATAFSQSMTGAGITLTATVELGSVATVAVDYPGAGFVETDSAIVVFSGGGQGDSAYGIGELADGVVTSITVVNGGFGYLEVPSITILPVAGGSGATAIVTGVSGGVIQTVQMLTGGSGYDLGATIIDSGQGTGSGTPPPFQSAVYQAIVEDGVVVQVTMISNGSTYSSAPVPNYISTSGAGAGGVVQVLGGAVTGVTFNYPSQGGSGYQTPPLVQFVGGGGPAAATIEMMPFGVMGNTIESYVSRIWIGNGNRLSFTAPGSVVDFGNGGGEFQTVDGSLRYEIVRLVQSNGFLYVIGDSSVNYISGVNTAPISNTNATLVTTFTFLNVDPQIGTPWPDSVTVFGRRVMFANTQGIYQIIGGAVEKVSDMLDDLFNGLQYVMSPLTVYPMGTYYPTAAAVSLFAKPCFCLLIPVIDPIVFEPSVKILMWDGQPGQGIPKGRWWTATQSLALLRIAGFESNSTLYAYGTDGNAIYQLFTTPSGDITKVLQSRQWIEPTIITQKKSWGLYALFSTYGDTTLDFQIDTEEESVAVTQGGFTGGASSTEAVPGLVFARSAAPAPAGVTVGFTMTSTSFDFALLDAVLVVQDYSLVT